MGSLKNLSLNDNPLQLRNLDPNTFSPLQNLIFLNVEKLNPAKKYADQHLSVLTNLTTLILDGIQDGVQLGKGFSKLKKLFHLTINGYFNYAGSHTFIDLENIPLEQLIIHSGQLYDIDTRIFYHLTNLKLLDIAGNWQIGLDNITKGIQNISMTSIEHLILNRTTNNYFIHDLNESFFINLQHTNLRTLYLDENFIRGIPLFGKYVPKLQYLSIAGNAFQGFGVSMAEDILLHLQEVVYINASYNARPYVYEQDGPRSTNKAVGSLSRQKFVLIFPKKLRYIYYRGTINRNYVNMVEMIFLGRTVLEVLDFSDNGLSNWDIPIQKQFPFPDGLLLDLSKNQCHSLTDHFFDNMGEIGILILYSNNLGQSFRKDKQGRILRNLTKLEYLDLSDNKIYDLAPNFFHNQNTLKTLKLDSNFLNMLNFRLDHIIHLKQLDLSTNLFHSLSLSDMDMLERIRSRNNSDFTVDLYGNPFICSCDTLDFLKWTNQTRTTLKNKQNYECLYKDRSYSFSEVYSRIIPQLQIVCQSKVWLIVTVISTMVIVVVVAISIFLYRHRWDVKYIILNLIHNRKRDQSSNDQNRSYAYDVFIAYHCDDESFVHDHLMPKLEEEQFKLCVHYRDFLGGVPIQENILNAINQSRKIILVISESFVQSDWCYLELQLTRIRCSDTGYDIMVPILLSQMPKLRLAKPVRRLLQTTSYVKWTDDPADQELFWRHLLAALRAHPVVATGVTD